MNSTADRPRAKSLAPLRALLPFLRPYRAMMAAALSALLVATVAMLALPLALRRVIDVLAAKDAGTTNRILHRLSGCGGDFRGVRRAALLSGDVARRTSDCRSASRRVPAT